MIDLTPAIVLSFICGALIDSALLYFAILFAMLEDEYR